ncbi:hypothetical protein KOI35_46690 [Actinoplanes bogorensis]|uniref:Tetratricopeptide repeat protein n=1 Tax=Paractinoplanes bogorensis TaxID=1610840 RepID=A0ABS5Z928_9ACTN|nr:hypothetical protein [Actinoplanes bogorensis]MBU2671010.1 hypothetical protein [Actinoplanes bogorensis]
MVEDDVVRQATLLCDVNRFDEATALVARLLATQPDSVRGWLTLARARLLAGDPDAAFDAALTAGRLAPDLADCHALAGAAPAAMGRYTEAARARTAPLPGIRVPRRRA